MANEVRAEDEYFFITWSISNFSNCWQKTGEALPSPSFCVNKSEEFKWKLLLFPHGLEDDSYITLHLYRGKNRVFVTDVNYRFGLLSSDGSTLYFVKDTGSAYSVRRVVISEGTKYLPLDNLTVRCRISSEKKTSEIQQLFIRTIINVEKMSCQSSIEKFSKLEPDKPQSFLVKSASKDIMMQIDLFVTNSNDKGIFMNIYPFDHCMKYFLLRTFILDSKKSKVHSGDYKCWLDNGECSPFTLKFTKNNLISNKNLYLPNDALTLAFELIISTGIAFNGIEKAICEYTSHLIPNGATENFRKCIGHKKISDCPCALVNDLTYLQKDQRTCDMKLKTKTNIFSVHTLILSTRSPVFKAMFSSEMKEMVNGCVDVADLDDETIRRFLLYLYTDQLEDLKWEDAFKLYTAADKYAVITLKDKCSEFLKNNLRPENVCKILTLSDLHQDKDLKETAQNYTIKNAKGILKSEEWKHLVDTNSKLAVETMSRHWMED